MPSIDEYLSYKRDTKHVLQWIIQTSNGIISSCSAKLDPQDEPKSINTTGKCTVAGLVPMAKLITKFSTKCTPDIVLYLLRSVIQARKKAWQHFQQSPSADKDEESNRSHKHFVDSLETVFQTLGGTEWENTLKEKMALKSSLSGDGVGVEVPIQNRFATLDISASISLSDTESSDNATGEDSSRGRAAARSRRGPRSKAARKRKGNKKIKRNRSAQDIPLDNYAFIQEPSSAKLEYYTAAASLAHHWVGMRAFMQGIWKQAVERDLRMAVAGAFSTMVVAKVKDLEFHSLLDFPGRDTYESVLGSLSAQQLGPASGAHGGTTSLPAAKNDDVSEQSTDVDLKEYYMAHMYDALCDFVTDFQKKRTGVPTKAMNKRLKSWDPKFDAKNASKSERVFWRYQFTVKWLYEMANSFLYLLAGGLKSSNQPWDLDGVQWSSEGPWPKYRRYFGLNEFAAQITSWAMEKEGTDIRGRVHPHHVFQLQCMIDSFTTSKGWRLSDTHQSTFDDAPPADFDPRKETDEMLRRDKWEDGQVGDCGLLWYMDTIDDILYGNSDYGFDATRQAKSADTLRGARSNLLNWIGAPGGIDTAEDGPASQFFPSKPTNPWALSPYLCGAALMEGLEMAHNAMSQLWDNMGEPLACMHIFNMLFQKGYLSDDAASGTIICAARTFSRDVFASDTVPTSDFEANFSARMYRISTRLGTKTAKGAPAYDGFISSTELHDLHPPKANKLFTTAPFPSVLRQVRWDVTNIPDKDVPAQSSLARARIAGTRRSVDPATGSVAFAESELLKRVQSESRGGDQAVFADAESYWQRSSAARPETARMGESVAFDDGVGARDESASLNCERGLLFSGFDVMQILFDDLHSSIQHRLSPLSINMAYFTIIFVKFWAEVEGKLDEVNNPLWVKVKGQKHATYAERRMALTREALKEKDAECLKIMADAIQDGDVPLAECPDCYYWSQMDEDVGPQPLFDQDAPPQCAIM